MAYVFGGVVKLGRRLHFMLEQMTIGRKLMSGFSALLMCLLGLGWLSLSAVDGLR
jgi:hypothetical protein